MSAGVQNRSFVKWVLCAAVAAASAFYYVLGLIEVLHGSPPVWWFVGSGALGAIAIQLVTGPDGPFASARLQARAARAWAAALALALVASAFTRLPRPWGTQLVVDWLLGSSPVLAVVLLIGVWWPRYVERDGAARFRPGYLIGGAALTATAILTGIGVSYHLWAPDSQSYYRFPSAAGALWLVRAALTPVLFAVPVRVLLAGLQRRAEEVGPPRPRRVTLVVMALTACWGYAIVLRLLALQPPALVPGRPAAIAATGFVWLLTMVWVGRLWRTSGKSAATA